MKKEISTLVLGALTLLAGGISFYGVSALTKNTSGDLFLAQLGSAIGITVGVLPNEANTLLAQLKEKEQALDVREQNISFREAELRGESALDEAEYYGRVVKALIAAVCALHVLVAVNFWFDHRRSRKERA